MSIFERKPLPLSAAPLYYQALTDLVDKQWSRLWRRIDKDEPEARAYVNLFRGEASAFMQTVIAHIDQQAKSQQSSADRKQALKDTVSWIGLIRRGATVAARRLSDKKEREALKALVHAGRDLSRDSAGAVVIETRYLSATLPDLKAKLSPPLHEAELARGESLSTSLETALYGRANATADQLNASVAKGKAWSVLEEKSKFLLELARLEFSKEPSHEDYAARIQFESLDEKFAQTTKTTAEPNATDSTAAGIK